MSDDTEKRLRAAAVENARLRAECDAERERVEKLSQENAVLRCYAAGERERVAKLRAVMDALLTEAEDVFVCMVDATGIGRHILPEPFRVARAVLSETGDHDEH